MFYKMISQIDRVLLQYLSPKRKDHSWRVATEAESLASFWKADIQAAHIAGLLHDIGKEVSLGDVQQRFSLSSAQSFQFIHQHYPPIWHAFIAPQLISYELGITDPVILNAVKWHTTGKAKMSVMDAIVFIADYIEPGRRLSDIEFIRNLAYSDLPKAVFAITQSSLLNLLKRNVRIHPFLIQCRNDMIQQCHGDEINTITQEIFRLNG